MYFLVPITMCRAGARRNVTDTVEADRLSFSFYFSAPENAFFIFRRFIFRPKKHPLFGLLFFFSVLKRPLKKNKKESQYFG